MFEQSPRPWIPLLNLSALPLLTSPTSITLMLGIISSSAWMTVIVSQGAPSLKSCPLHSTVFRLLKCLSFPICKME